MRYILISTLVFIIACNNSKEAGEKTDKYTAMPASSADKTETTTGKGNCGNMVLFKQGTIVEAASYDAVGKETSRQLSTVTKVSDDGAVTTAELDMQSTGAGNADKVLKGIYKCDGKTLYVDMTSLFANMEAKGATIEGSPIEFPIILTEGQTLPDASYSFTMKTGGKAMKITFHIRNRKVEGKESVTTGAGTFESYIITSDVDADTEMPGMDEKMKRMMDAMKKSMPKKKFKMWYAPGVSIVKMELYTGDKLTSRNEVISIKN